MSARWMIFMQDARPERMDNHILGPLKTQIETVFENRELLEEPASHEAIGRVIELLDSGELRTASPQGVGGGWTVHAWVMQAILLYFVLRNAEPLECGPFEFRDKIPLKRGLEKARVRVVPPGVARY